MNPLDDIEQVAHDAEEGVEKAVHAAGDVVSGAAQGVEDVAGGVVDAVGDVVGGVARGVEDEVGGLVEGLGDLFGGDDEQTVAQKEAGDVKKEQGELQKMLADNGDFSTSDQILDAGTVGLRFFADFIPVYQQAAQYVNGAQNTNIDLSRDIYRNYDETRGIDMGRFRGDADHIDGAVKQITTSQQNLSSSFGSLSDWTGSGADAARRYNDSLLGAMSGFVTGKGERGDGLPAPGQPGATGGAQSAPQVIRAAMSNIQTALKGQAKNIGGMYSTQCGGQTVEQVQDNIRKASGDLNIGDIGGESILSGIMESAKDAFLGGLFGGGIGGLIGGLTGALESGEKTRQNIINQAKQQLQAFVAEFDSKKSAFDQQIQTVQQTISQDYKTMLDGLKPLQQDPTKGISDPPSFEVHDHGGNKHQGGHDRGDHRSGGGGAGGGGNSGGGTVPVSGTTPSGSTTPPTTGTAPTTTPTVGPTGATGHPETVTIHDGDSTIQLSSPDGRGHVKLTVDDGSGRPKTYDVDFGEGAGAGKTSGPGISGPGGATGTGTSGFSGGTGRADAGGLGAGGTASSGAGDFGPIGSSGIAGAGIGRSGSGSTETVDDSGVHHVQAGPDGTATIHDGNETITVQRPDGASGDMKLTVDDGSGQPKTYDVDFSASTTSSAAQAGAGTFDAGSAATSVPADAGIGGGGTAVGAAGGGSAGGVSAGAGPTQLGAGGATGASDSVPAGQAPAAASGAPASGGAPAGGMPMMGGMGAGSQGGGKSSERGANPLLRGTSEVFDTDEANRVAKIRRVLEGN